MIPALSMVVSRATADVVSAWARARDAPSDIDPHRSARTSARVIDPPRHRVSGLDHIRATVPEDTRGFSQSEVSREVHDPFTPKGERWWPTSARMAAMRSMHRLVPALLCSLASPVYASDNLGDLARAYTAARMTASHTIPSYARQTGLACSACHYQFLTLTPFGRKFKLNGYTLTNQPSLVEKDSTNGGRLSLSPFSLLSGMVTAGVTHTKDALPDTQNGAAALPQELSGFLAGRLSAKIGMFSQFTYAGA